MGADLIARFLTIPWDTEPDFAKARLGLDNLTPEIVNKRLLEDEEGEITATYLFLDWDGVGDPITEEVWSKEVKHRVIEALDTVEAGWNDNRRDFICFRVSDKMVLFTGHIAFDETEGGEAIRICRSLGLTESAGFDF